MVEKAYNRAKTTNRTTLLTPKARRAPDQKVSLIMQYNSQRSQVGQICRQFWPMLRTDPDLKDRMCTYGKSG